METGRLELPVRSIKKTRCFLELLTHGACSSPGREVYTREDVSGDEVRASCKAEIVESHIPSRTSFSRCAPCHTAIREAASEPSMLGIAVVSLWIPSQVSLQRHSDAPSWLVPLANANLQKVAK